MRRHIWLATYKRIALLLLCALTVALAAGCAEKPANAPTATPAARQTADPRVSGDAHVLQEKLLAGASEALLFEVRALSEYSNASSARIPDQLVNQFLDALTDDKAWTHEQGHYTLTVTSGGDFVYEKPYSKLIHGSSTDVYTIENDEGMVEEIVDNTLYDPFTWVMSGEGGGEFAYMTVYDLREDAGGGTVETVSRFNGAISGWAHDAFDTAGGRYRFVDLQLSPDEEGVIEAPYQWILCIGDIGKDSVRIEEFSLKTDELKLPIEGFSLSETAEALTGRAEQFGKRRSLLTMSDGNINYTEYN